MVTFTVIYEDASKVIYGYYPDGDKENEGQICVPSNGEAYLLKPAEGDDFGTYSYCLLYTSDAPTKRIV